jgi:hypothetical protein
MPATVRERMLFFQACWHHVTPRCPRCQRVCRVYELAADFLVGKSERCWGCATDLGDVIAQHLATCRTAAVFAREAGRGAWPVRPRSRDLARRRVLQRERMQQALESAEDLLTQVDERRRRRAG